LQKSHDEIFALFPKTYEDSRVEVSYKVEHRNYEVIMSLENYRVCSTINAECIDESSVSYLLKKLYEDLERELLLTEFKDKVAKVEKQKADDNTRCKNCTECNVHNGSMCTEYFGPDNCPSCSCKVKKDNTPVYKDYPPEYASPVKMPDFKQYTSKYPLGPPRSFYNSRGKMYNIQGMKTQYQASTMKWLAKNFNFELPEHKFAKDKYEEFAVVYRKT